MASIWKHGDSLRDLKLLKDRLHVNTCPHCGIALTDLKNSNDWGNHPKSVMSNFDRSQMKVAACGWGRIFICDKCRGLLHNRLG